MALADTYANTKTNNPAAYEPVSEARAALLTAVEELKEENARLTWNSNAAELLQHHVNTANMEITTLEAENERLREALKEYVRAGAGNSTDWRVQLKALQLATPLLDAARAALEDKE